MDDGKLIEYGKKVVRAEGEAVLGVVGWIGEEFARAVRLVHNCSGRVVVTGMGKAGLIGRKISATFASTGTPSLYLHPAEALHGDLGRVVDGDVVIALSNSGETEELVRLVPYVKRAGAVVVAITADRKSPLGEVSDVVLEMGHIEEACPLGLAPSASTAAMLALGDALALSVLQLRLSRGEFSVEQYAAFHPAGSLGRKALRVEEVMRTGKRAPTVSPDATVQETILAITEGRAGAAVVVDNKKRLLGIFTDGDLRRYIKAGGDPRSDKIGDVMVKNPKHIRKGALAAEAHSIMRKHQIGELPVVDDTGQVVGVVNLKDITGITEG